MPRPPTKTQREAARKVLTYYRKQAQKLAEVTEQETPTLWSDSIDTCIELLKHDPKTTMADYFVNYRAGR